MTRQNYYKARSVRRRREVDVELVVELVRSEHAVQPRLGGRKLHVLLQPEFEKTGVGLGRDRFFEVLSRKGLLQERLPKSTRTTYSRHTLPVFTNQVKGMEITGPNQAWAADITYLRIDGGFVYLSLRICIREKSLETEGSLRALEMAVKELKEGESPVHRYRSR